MTVEKGNGEGASGALVVRIIGGLLLVLGAWSLLGLLGIHFPAAPAQAHLLGIWPISGWQASLCTAIMTGILFFAGVQLLRLRRSGWIATLVVLGYTSLYLFLWIVTNQIVRDLELALKKGPDAELLSKPVVGDVLIDSIMRENAHVFARVKHIAWFFFACHFVPFLYLLSEWRRFVGTRGVFSRKWVQLRLALALSILGGWGLWTFWGAGEVLRLRVVRSARADIPDLDAIRRLSPQRQREVTAILVRRLVGERTDELASAVSLSPGDLSCLTAEDIPAIIAAAHADSVEVRGACYELLGQIATQEARDYLRAAVNGEEESSSAWETALRGLTLLRATKVPERLLKLAQEPSDSREYFVGRLGSFRDARVVPILLEAAQDEDPEVRGRAIDGLSDHPGTVSEKALQQALKDKELWIRGLACDALRCIGTTNSIPLLIEALKVPRDAYQSSYGGSGSLHEDASFALRVLTRKDFGKDPEVWKAWWREEGSEFELGKEILAQLRKPLPPEPPKRPPRSLEEMRSEPYASYLSATGEQVSAIRTIRRHQMREMASEVARYLQRYEERATPANFLAAEVLSEWGYREGIKWLIERVDINEGKHLRRWAMRMLGQACNVNFFGDKERWRKWWEANHHRFPSAVDTRPKTSVESNRVETGVAEE